MLDGKDAGPPQGTAAHYYIRTPNTLEIYYGEHHTSTRHRSGYPNHNTQPNKTPPPADTKRNPTADPTGTPPQTGPIAADHHPPTLHRYNWDNRDNRTEHNRKTRAKTTSTDKDAKTKKKTRQEEGRGKPERTRASRPRPAPQDPPGTRR